MSGGINRPGLATRLRTLLGWRAPEHSVRDHIAELVQEAADAPQQPGMMEELDRHERALIANILRLRGTMADDVMVPRADIVAISADLSLEAALQVIRAEGHSRLPVYGEELDDILGMIHIKDVFAHVGSPETFSLRAILRRPLMVAPQISVLDLLLQMRQARMHLALVVDEYGGIDGLLTIEDLVETIVGDIADEHDEVEGPMVTERPDGTLDINARLSVEDFETRLGRVLTDAEREADIETVGGLVFTLAGRVPARGEVISHPSGIEFRILDGDPRHIRRLRVRVPDAVKHAAAAKPDKDAKAAAE
jgi:magnesium and cobalt transporter